MEKAEGSACNLNSKKRRLGGGGRKAALPDLEEELVAWIESLRAQNLRVTRSSVQSKALEFTQARRNEEFHASDGWLQKFLKRHSFCLRRRTTVGQRLPQDLITKVVGFIMSTRRFRRSKNYSVLHRQHG